GDHHALVINWGDGSPSQVFGPLGAGVTTFSSIAHQYLDDNPTGTSSDTNTISVTVLDDSLQSASGSTTVIVNNVAPTLSGVSATSGDESSMVALSGNIGDPGTRDTFSLVVDWGDGSLPQTFNYSAGTHTFAETHRYLDDNPSGTPSDNYSISLSLADDDGGT